MSEASISVDQDRFICPVCLDLLKDPVTVPCGHSFCKVCINDHWDKVDEKRVYSCPQCRETFTPRPVLRRNNMLAEVVEQLKKTELQAAHSYAGATDVGCDSCTGKKHKAVKSCLTCLASFCETHVQPHHHSPAFKKHHLVDACSKLQEKICSQHDKLIEVYCRTDQSCICYVCMMHEHRGHDTVAAVSERTDKQSELKEVQRKCQQRLQEKQKNLEDVKQAVNTLKSSAQTTLENSERTFTELIRSIQKQRTEVRKLIRDQEKTEVSRAEGVLKKLEQEIAELKRRDAELEQLLHTEDHIHFLKSFQSLCVSPGPEDSSSIKVSQHLSFDGVRKSLSDLKEKLAQFCREEFIQSSPHAAAGQTMLPTEPKCRDDFLKYFCHLTLDPNTAHRYLSLSEDSRVAMYSEREQRYSGHPERFEYWNQVLCKESVSGCCYWEVEWSSGERCVYVSVSYKEISRKGRGNECGFGRNNQSWSLCCASSLSFYHNNTETKISAPPSSRIGVYVDHNAGTLSFYSLSDTMTLLHKVQTIFTQPLYAGFWIGYKSAVRLCDPK